MLTINYEGRTYVLKTMKIKCLKCNTFCETSEHHQIIADCDCCLVRLDGGISMGATVNGNPWAMEDYSIYRTEHDELLPQEIVTQKHQELRENMIKQYRKYGLSQKDLDEIKSGR